MKFERLSWGLFLQTMIFIALIAGIIHSEWALSLLIWLAQKTKNMMTRLQISYYEHIDDFIVQLQKAGRKIQIGIKILSFIFAGLILASIILLLVHQPIYAALCVLILAIGPFLLAHALSVAALDLIAMPIAGLAAWLLLIAFNFLVWPSGTINLGWRLSILILLMLISSVFVISGRKTRGAPLVLAIALSASMMIYSSSSWVQAIGNQLGGKFAISAASSNRWASADQRKAEAIREFTKGIVVEEGLFRDKDNPKTITQRAVKNTPVMIEYKDGKPVRPEPASALSQQFKGSFCKIYLQDKDGSFPRTDRSWWIEDIKIQDTKVLMSTKNPSAGQREVNLGPPPRKGASWTNSEIFIGQNLIPANHGGLILSGLYQAGDMIAIQGPDSIIWDVLDATGREIKTYKPDGAKRTLPRGAHRIHVHTKNSVRTPVDIKFTVLR